MVARTAQALDDLQIPDDQRLAVLTEASIVQAEAGSADDMAQGRPGARQPAGRRACRCSWTPRSTTPTARPASPRPPQDRRNPSPYNTYLHAGLPPGAISNPGEEALRGGAGPDAGQLAVLRRGRPGHRRDPVRGDRARSTSRTCSCSSSGCGSTRTDEAGVRAAVLGRPVAHSLSPLLHRAAYAALGLDDWTLRRPGRRAPRTCRCCSPGSARSGAASR